MADARDQAVNEFRKKLTFERELITKLQKLDKQIVREFTKELGLFRNIIQASRFDEELIDVLTTHYENVGGEFSDQVKLPKDVAETDEERDAIATALALFYTFRSSEQAAIINSTTQLNMNEAAAAGAEEAMQQAAETGQLVSNLEAAVLSGVILSRKLRGRQTTIAQTETQAVAETAKSVETSILIGQQPDTQAITPRVTKVNKEWVTFGDEKVREAHIAADGQIVDVSEPFIVGGELLMRPGDDSLGASAGNIINCRCSSITPQEEIAEVRRQ